MSQEQAKHYAELVIRFLKERKGFDDWWDSIDPFTQDILLHELADHIANNPL